MTSQISVSHVLNALLFMWPKLSKWKTLVSFLTIYLVTYSSEKPKANFSGLSHVDRDQAKHLRHQSVILWIVCTFNQYSLELEGFMHHPPKKNKKLIFS